MSHAVDALCREARRVRLQAALSGQVPAERLLRDAEVIERCIAIVEEVEL